MYFMALFLFEMFFFISNIAAFGQPFDEIVVESTLNVKRKAGGARQSRTDQAASVRTKRQQK